MKLFHHTREATAKYVTTVVLFRTQTVILYHNNSKGSNLNCSYAVTSFLSYILKFLSVFSGNY